MPTRTQTLQTRLRAVPLKRAGVALGLWGEPGIGKSYTVRELLRETPCRTVSLHATAPLSELSRALSRPAALPAWAESLLVRLERGEHLEGEKTASALAALLAGLAPVVLHLEDLHEASPEQLELVQKLARMVTRTRGAALLVTSRTRPPEPFSAERMEPLDADGVRRLLEGETGAALPEEAHRWVYAQAAGNPLFTLEFFRHLARQGFLWNDGRSWHWRKPPVGTMPLTVEALIERLIGEATAKPQVRDALEARAMLPPEACEGLWAEVSGLTPEALARASLELQRQGLMRGQHFAHPLFREVGLNLMPQPRRLWWARRALEALRDPDPQAAAAYVEQAGLPATQALELLGLAAEKAKQSGNEVQAARLLAQAVEYAEGKEKGRLALQAAQGLRQVDLSRAIELAELAVKTQSEPTAAVYELAELLAGRGQIAEANAVLQRLGDSEPTGPGWAARLLRLRVNAGDYAGVLELCREYPELLAEADPETAYFAAFSMVSMGQVQQALEVASAVLARPGLTPAEEGRLLSACGLGYCYLGDYARAKAVFGESLAKHRKVGPPRSLAATLHNRTIALQGLGEFREMRADLEEALRLYGEIGDVKRYSSTQSSLAWLLKELGEYERAEEILLESRQVLLRLDASDYLVDCEGYLTHLYREWAPPHGQILALKHAQAALHHARFLNNPRLLADGLVFASMTETAQGNAALGLEQAEEALILAEKLGQPIRVSSARFARGLALEALGQKEKALLDYRQAEELLKGLARMLDAHAAGLEADRLTGDVEQARQRLRWFGERGLQNRVNIALRYFPHLATLSPDAKPLQTHPPSPKRLETHLSGAKRLETNSSGAKRLEVLGTIQFSGEPLRGRKRQELLAFVLETRVAGRSEAGKLELLDALYPGEDEEKAASSLKELIRTVRSALGPEAITTTPSGYALGDSVGSDLEEFLRTGNTALWRGAYLEGFSPFNETVRESVYLALRQGVETRLGADPKEAARLGRILLEADPYDLAALRLTLEALRRSQNHKSLNRLYGEARERMLEVGEQLPDTWQAFLAAAESFAG